jgi:hypothetical protein
MRIWDIEPCCLCRNHLLGEHRELHAVWSIITGDKKGYKNHPETVRWRGKLAALYRRHQELVREMNLRGYRHESPLDPDLATGEEEQNEFVDSINRQRAILIAKDCPCPMDDV